jgi:hypothetical protein
MRAGSMKSGEGRRQQKRELFTITVEYSFSSFSRDSLNCETGSGITTNISPGGLGFYTDRLIRAGQDLKVFSSHLSTEPINAVVRWCDRISDNMYKVGMMFA